MTQWQISRVAASDNPEDGSQPILTTEDVEIFEGDEMEASARVDELSLATSHDHSAVLLPEAPKSAKSTRRRS